MKTIHIYYINRIKDCDLRIFEAEDSDYPDYNVVRANIRAINHWLCKAGITDEKEKEEILDKCVWYGDNCSEALEKLGYFMKKE